MQTMLVCGGCIKSYLCYNLNMNVVTIPKSEYKKIQREQNYLRSEISELRKIVQRVAGEELAPTTIRRLLGRSRNMDNGGGIRFNSTKEVKKYLRQI